MGEETFVRVDKRALSLVLLHHLRPSQGPLPLRGIFVFRDPLRSEQFSSILTKFQFHDFLVFVLRQGKRKNSISTGGRANRGGRKEIARVQTHIV